MVEKCVVCGHTTEDETEMALHLGDDHSSWDLADYGYDCLVESGSKYDPKLPPRGTGLRTGRAGKRRAGKPRTQAQRRKRHKNPPKWIKETNRKRLAKLSAELKKSYDYMEQLFKSWRKKNAPDYMFRYLSEAQEQIWVARRKILELLGST